MPSWNIHTAHAERLFADTRPGDLGVEDSNAFLFGSYVPDIYLGFMVPDTTFRIGYCLTHHAMPNMIPLPDADRFWDTYVSRMMSRAGAQEGREAQPVRAAQSTQVERLAADSPGEIAAASRSLVLGVWAHLMADRIYNGRFRMFLETHDGPTGEELRMRKQADFDLFGNSLGISSHVEATSALIEAAQRFRPYSILPDDLARALDVANSIVDVARSCPSSEASGVATAGSSVEDLAGQGGYQIVSREWLTEVFDSCDERLHVWLRTWKALQDEGAIVSSSDIRKEAGLPPAPPDSCVL